MSSPRDLPLDELPASTQQSSVEISNERNEAPIPATGAAPPSSPTVTNEHDRSASSSDNPVTPKVYHTGWRLHALTTALCLGLLLSTLETTIVSTALVPIVDALQGFDHASWIVTSYLVTYTGFLIIYSKLSDIFGCKLMLLFAITMFTVFSMACGASKSMTPLALGPVLGGVITDHTSWRWVFYFNGPGGLIAATLLAFSIPFSFPYGETYQVFNPLAFRKKYKRVDFLGMVLSLAASILIIFALEQGGVAYPWESGTIISTFVLSAILWVSFIAWERLLSKRNGTCEPMFPWSLVHNRFVMGLILNGFLTGFPFMAALINIPQRFQTVNMTSAINAGIRTLPLLLLSPIATAANGLLVSKLGVPPLYTLSFGGCLQTIGVGMFSSLRSSTTITTAQYGYEAIMGLGFGFSLSAILIMVPLVVTEKDLAVTMGAVTQVRVLGGTIGLAICSALLINHINTEASEYLTREQVEQILLSPKSIGSLPHEGYALLLHCISLVIDTTH
ncbi:major facilitator superfamily transporter [Fusarium heterosporum]|uniref:Major facilitator superfamily transporter n=1 Tax=Fusarium heterosporum TaxID=42747 RepID=A0A8H5WVL0_FUSHE|nr:major facilitator superfamily transporter [Fusarium heterosporum]